MKNEQTRRMEKDFKISIMLTTLSQILFVVFFFFFPSSTFRKDNCQPNTIKSLSKLENVTISFVLHFLEYYFGSPHAKPESLVLGPRSRPTITVPGLHFKGPFQDIRFSLSQFNTPKPKPL